MANALFYGGGTALITPFSGEGIDYGAWERLIDAQTEAGTDALIVLGSTGEAPTVTPSERRALISIAVSMARGRVPVIVGISSNSTKTARELGISARELGADGALISAPYYNRPTDAGMARHFTAIADAARIPLIIYNIPSRTGVNISPALMCELARNPLIQGIKEASADANQISEMARALAGGVALYAGNDNQIIPIMALGGRGVISVIGNIAPRETRAITHAMLRDDCETARAAYMRIAPLISALACEVNPGPIKFAMSLLGACVPDMRLPLCEISESSKIRVSRALDECGLLRV